MLLNLFIAAIPFFTLTTLGFLFIVNNPKDRNNIWFSVLSFSLALWVASNYLAESNIDNSLLWTRLAFFSVTIALGAFVLFTSNYPVAVISNKKIRKLIYASVAIVALTTFHHSFVPSVRIEDGTSNVVTGPAYWVFLLFFAFTVVPSVVFLIRAARKSSGANKQRAKIILFGVSLMLIIGSITNLILPLITKENPLATVGSYSTIFFVGFTYYAVARHRFLDVRSLVARSLAYLFVLVTLLLIYTAVFYTSSSLFIDVSNVTFPQRAIFAIIAVVLALTFQPIKLFFDKVTNRVFFRESYDSQEVLDKLSSLLATEIDLKKIVEQSSDLLMSSLKPTYMRFAVFKDGGTYMDYRIGTNSHNTLARSQFEKLNQVLVVRDQGSESVKNLLDNYDADVLLRLEANEETVGVILMGHKESGTVYSKRDVDLLKITEKELAIAVQNARYFEQIQEFNAKLQEEIEQATSELKASNTKLKELDEAKDEFISMASHQLRTPLTSVKGYISMVVDGDAGKIKSEQKKLLEEAFASSQRMVYLIADLLNVSRLKTGKFVIDPAEVNLADLVEQEVSQLKPTAKSRKLKLEFDKPGKFPKIWLDETKVRQVVMNFIDNAIYYTPAGGSIDVILGAKKDTIEFKVKDSGIGVPKNEQPKLFTKFYRAANARRARPDGTGLGLYMAQRVVSAQGGSIIFKSKENEGSTFGFSFPLSSVKTKQALLSHTKEPEDRPEQDE